MNVPASLIDQVGQVETESSCSLPSKSKRTASPCSASQVPTDGRPSRPFSVSTASVPDSPCRSCRGWPGEPRACGGDRRPAEFKGVPGVGTRIAQRIVMELKGKLEIEMTAAPTARPDAELTEALAPLGYTMSEVMEAAASLPRDEPLEFEEKVRLVLDYLGGQ